MNGLAVQSPELFYEDGKEIGEIDVTLRGDFGSSKIFIGIECRDRPSEGLQGIDWITQIKGKRDLLKIDKMIAVSSTGFTEPAIKAAKDFNIDLMTISDIAQFNASEWFEATSFTWAEDFYIIDGVVDITTLPKLRNAINIEGKLLIQSENKELVPISHYVRPKVEELFAELPIEVGIYENKELINISGPLTAFIDDKKIKIDKMKVPLKLSREVIERKFLLNAYKRINGEITAVTGICSIESTRRRFKIVLIAKKNKTDASLIDIRYHLLDENNQPYIIPKGTKISLFGW